MENLKEQAEAIIQARSMKENSAHIWLNGMYEITENSILETSRVDNYVEGELKKFNAFTKLVSSSQSIKLYEAPSFGFDLWNSTVNLGKLDKERKRAENNSRPVNPASQILYVHLPINKNYHLEFPLINKDLFCKFIYTICPLCENIDSHCFPEISLRESINFQKKQSMYFYDNRISVDSEDVKVETILDSYKSIDKFIKNTSLY